MKRINPGLMGRKGPFWSRVVQYLGVINAEEDVKRLRSTWYELANASIILSIKRRLEFFGLRNISR